MDKKCAVKVAKPTPAVPVDVQPMKILFLGNEDVGKTTFIMNYINHLRHNVRIDTYVFSYLAFWQHIFEKERRGRLYSIWLLDLPIGSTVDDRVDQYPAEVDIVVLCYAIDDPNSLDNVLTRWLGELSRHFENGLPHYHLLGLKNDLRNDQDRIQALDREGRHPVTLLEALSTHQDFRSFSGDYMDCSVLSDPEQAVYCMETLIDYLFSYRGFNLPA